MAEKTLKGMFYGRCSPKNGYRRSCSIHHFSNRFGLHLDVFSMSDSCANNQSLHTGVASLMPNDRIPFRISATRQEHFRESSRKVEFRLTRVKGSLPNGRSTAAALPELVQILGVARRAMRHVSPLRIFFDPVIELR